MPLITSSYIKKELNNISFFMKSAELFEGLGVKITGVLEDLPIEWDSSQTDGKAEYKGGITWKIADLEGKLNDKPIKIKITREFGKDNASGENEIKRIKYKISYEGKGYLVSSLSKLTDAVEKLSSGKTPKPKIMQMVYDLIQHRKAEIYTHIKRNFLVQVSKDTWFYKVSKDASRIYLRFYVKVDDSDTKKEIEEKLTEHDNYRLDSVGSYLETLFNGEGIKEISKENNMTHSIIKLSDQAGFVITIK